MAQKTDQDKAGSAPAPAEDFNPYHTLTRTEAIWVKNWLEELGKPVGGGWTGVYRMRLVDIAQRYKVPVQEVAAAARGEKR
jgi:hypothetical protein